MYCKLCEKQYIGVAFGGYFCDKPCRKIKHIISVYGAEDCYGILNDICLRDAEKRKLKSIKVTEDIAKGCYSPSCIKK